MDHLQRRGFPTRRRQQLQLSMHARAPQMLPQANWLQPRKFGQERQQPEMRQRQPPEFPVRERQPPTFPECKTASEDEDAPEDVPAHVRTA